jgi:hypothetical protein
MFLLGGCPMQYAITIPLFVFAAKRNLIDKWFMVRPGVFMVIRIATFVVRLVLVGEGIAEGTLSE